MELIHPSLIVTLFLKFEAIALPSFCLILDNCNRLGHVKPCISKLGNSHEHKLDAVFELLRSRQCQPSQYISGLISSGSIGDVEMAIWPEYLNPNPEATA